MTLRKIVLDTNLYIGWLNAGLHPELMLGGGLVRYLSAVVKMELRMGATTLPARRALDQLARVYRVAQRVIVPTAEQFDEAGRALQRLRQKGLETRRASLVHDVLIALTARGIGATVFTADRDYEAVRSVVDVSVQMVVP
jgi:predicted nucleic acid-binding protein